MHDLVALTPLGHRQPHSETIGTLRIDEICDAAMASLSMRLGKTRAFQAATKQMFGEALPKPGKFGQGNGYTLIWSAPDQWFVEAPLATHEDIDVSLKGVFADSASITLQTDAWSRFEVSGAGCFALLELLCPLDIRTIAAGDAARTPIEHLACILVCHQPGQRYGVMSLRSAAGSLHHALESAARSVA